MELANQVMGQFAARQHFGVRASPDHPDNPDPDANFVAVYYQNRDMLMTGGDREMPPFLLFRASHIWMSASGKADEWANADSAGLAPLALLDPRRVIEAADATRSPRGNIVEPDQAFVDLVLLLKDAVKEPNVLGADQHLQLVKFARQDPSGVVTQMDQADITGSGEHVTINFVTQPPPRLPSYELPPP